MGNFKGTVPVRWIGFILAILGVYVLSSANISTQWLGWTISSISCTIWVYMGWKDKDIPRMLMELVYVFLSVRAILNWLNLRILYVYIGVISIKLIMYRTCTIWCKDTLQFPTNLFVLQTMSNYTRL